MRSQAERGIEHQDLTIGSMVADEGRALVIAINKWDLIPEKQKVLKDIHETVKERLAQMPGLRVVTLSALGIGALVAVTGSIGFIGLVAPHLVRLTIGPDHRFLLPGSALLGAVLLGGADLGARTLAAPAELPIGLLTSLIGGPFFLWLIRRQAGSLES